MTLGDHPVDIVPDTKNWTWVLSRACPECGLDTQLLSREEIPALLGANVARWPAVLARPDARRRPAPATWSPLEYGCHVRDVFRIFTDRLDRMMTESDPLFSNWDQDQTAVEERYGEQMPATVAAELVSAGETLAGRFASVHGDQWERPGRRSDGAHFTVDTFARYLLHDPVHHLYDVTR